MNDRTPSSRRRSTPAATFVSAGAGTGKTTVLVERFARAVIDDGLDVDSLLVITYTRAAGELRARIRAALLELERPDLARDLDGAWISTIHGFCRRLLRRTRSRPASTRGSACSTRAGARAAGRGVRCRAGRVLRRRRAGSLAAARDLQGGRAPQDAGERLRHAALGGTQAGARAGEPRDLAGRVAALREAASMLADERGDRHDALGRARRARPARRGCRSACIDLARAACRGARAAAFRTPEGGGRRRSRSWRRATASCSRSCSPASRPRTPRPRIASRRSTSRTCSCVPASCCARTSAIREVEQLRFRSIMVDEFQDTNALQTDLVDLLVRRPDQGAVLRRRRVPVDLRLPPCRCRGVPRAPRGGAAGAAADAQLPLAAGGARGRQRAVRRRVRGELPAACRRGGYGDPVFGHPFELLVTDKASYAGSGVQWRRAEARHVARRVRELVDAGAATPGEIVLLFAAGTDAEWFEEELRARRPADDPHDRAPLLRPAAGRRPARYLRLLQNRYDDEALLTVLASPFVGVSNDALVLIRANAERRPIFKGIERTLPGRSRRGRPAARARVPAALRAPRRGSTRLSLELLCERILVEHDYDLAVLTRRDGQRRYANLRKLARLARSYEELRGPDIEGFIRFVAEQEAVGAPERDAVSEEEGADAVRLLTIHAAKGLEFKVVVVADAGRERARADEILCLSDGRFGFKVAHPSTGTRVSTTSYYRPSRRRRIEAEERRAAAPLLRRDDPGDGPADRLGLGRPLERARRSTPIGWVLERLGLEEELDRAEPPGRSRSSEATPRSCCASTASTRSASSRRRRPCRRGARRRASSSCSKAPGRRSRPRGAAAARARRDPGAAARTASRGSRTRAHLALRPVRLPLLRGARRRHAAGAVGAALRWRRAWRAASDRDRRCRAPPARARRPREPGGAGRRRARAGRRGAGTRPSRRGDRADRRARALVHGLGARRRGSPRCAASGPSGRSHSSSTACSSTAGSTCSGSRASGRSCSTTRRTHCSGATRPRSSRRSTCTQQIVYAIACLRAGATEVEVVYHFLEDPDAVVSTVFTADDAPRLEAHAQRLDRAHPGGRVPAHAERLRLLGLPGARTSSAPGRGSAASTKARASRSYASAE